MSYQALICDKLTKMNVEWELVAGSAWVKCQCVNPEHIDEHPSAGINVESAIFNCFSCGHTEKFISSDDTEDMDDEDLLWEAKYSALANTVEEAEIYLQWMTLPPVGTYIDTAWRGVSQELLKSLSVYYCDHGLYKGRYVFPMYHNGVSVGFDARVCDSTAINTKAKWIRPKGMKAASIVYPEGIIRCMGSSHIVITEGVMDAVSYLEMKVPAMASFGISPPSDLRIETMIALGIESVTLAFDNDDAGIAGMLKVLPYYSKWFDIVDHPMVAMVRNSGYKDANEFLVGVRENGVKEQERGWDSDEL